jgi:cell division protein FtsW (lipid II flippase)
MIRRFATISAVIGAAILSLALLTWGGASTGWVALQAGAALAALVLVVLLGGLRGTRWIWLGWIPFLLTGIDDNPLEGVHRWIGLGPFQLHVGLVLLVPLLIAISTRPDRRSVGVLTLVAAVIAIQPDRGTALVMLLGSLALYFCDRNWYFGGALWVAAISFVATVVFPDPLTPVPMVEHVLTDAWAYGWLVGAACWLVAVALCLAPAIERGWSRPTIIFAIGWGGFFLASLIGAYPVPLLGFGVSAWLGWALSVRQLRDVARA